MQMEELAVNTKLVINMSEGTVQVEGTEEFVRFVYQDFKENLSKNVGPRQALPALEQATKTPPLLTDQTVTPKKRSRKTGSSDGPIPRAAAASKPKFNTALDLSALEQFFDDWKPENNFDKILVFAVFLRDQLEVAPCSADDIYTCFATLNRKGKTKVPEAFAQAIRDTQGRTHFIDYKTMQAIDITIAGDNHFNEKKKNTKE
jgi:hypothetical protein